ncbi:unnamed protein product [Leptidea sinapis]|uniref:Uncharacterized protein n=1 Tax=Leptidea sinapis TaxID=189913 RepID=A0A5E4R6Q2_9NEOP|nr:unnamed protein product [Leptidea sinapis]
MANVSEVEAMRDETNCEGNEKENLNIKEEVVISVKREEVECAVCLGRNIDYLELNKTKTMAGTSLSVFLSRYTQQLNLALINAKYICKECSELINVLENAELEYMKLKEHFESVISKNPLFEVQQLSTLAIVKEEENIHESQYRSANNSDSEDLPLILTRKRKTRKKLVKKRAVSNKQVKKKNTRKNNRERLVHAECDSAVETEEQEATPCALSNTLQVDDIKTEDSHDKSNSENMYDTMFKVEDDGFDDDDTDYVPEEQGEEKRNVKLVRKHRPKNKCNHTCDCVCVCVAVRLEQHKQKHGDTKPPYICEVCGAHYKHKRACDIHVSVTGSVRSATSCSRLSVRCGDTTTSTPGNSTTRCTSCLTPA